MSKIAPDIRFAKRISIVNSICKAYFDRQIDLQRVFDRQFDLQSVFRDISIVLSTCKAYFDLQKYFQPKNRNFI